MSKIELIGLAGMPLVETGDDLASLITGTLEENQISLIDQDVLVITSKIVSKAEGRWADLDEIIPDGHALDVAAQCGKDPREVALILSEAESISRVRQGVLIVRHKLGFVCANAGVDHSNARSEENWRLLLPVDPDQSASKLRDALQGRHQVSLGVVISDSHGRPFRMGTVGTAIGASGLPSIWDLRGQPDLFGKPLQYTEVGFADELAAAAGLILGQANEATPVVLIRGVRFPVNEQLQARNLVRTQEFDLYR